MSKYIAKECVFSTGIDESLTCSLSGSFDEHGFPLEKCPDFPCDRFKILSRDVELRRLHSELETERLSYKSLTEIHEAFKEDHYEQVEKLEAEVKRLSSERKSLESRIMEDISNKVIFCEKCRQGYYDPEERLVCPLCELDHLRVELQQYDELARHYHNGYLPHMQKEFGMKEPETPLQAFKEVLDEKVDIDMAGWEAALKECRTELEKLKEKYETPGVCGYIHGKDNPEDHCKHILWVREYKRSWYRLEEKLIWALENEISAEPNHPDGYHCGMWVRTEKYGRRFRHLGWGKTVLEALDDAFSRREG